MRKLGQERFVDLDSSLTAPEPATPSMLPVLTAAVQNLQFVQRYAKESINALNKVQLSSYPFPSFQPYEFRHFLLGLAIHLGTGQRQFISTSTLPSRTQLDKLISPLTLTTRHTIHSHGASDIQKTSFE